MQPCSIQFIYLQDHSMKHGEIGKTPILKFRLLKSMMMKGYFEAQAAQIS